MDNKVEINFDNLILLHIGMLLSTLLVFFSFDLAINPFRFLWGGTSSFFGWGSLKNNYQVQNYLKC
jgi:hypothetical protein